MPRPAATFTKFLIESLEDEAVRRVTMVTYTGEGDHAVIDRSRIRHAKEVHVYKRSVLEDLAEQQTRNARLLARGKLDLEGRHWNKRDSSIAASEHLERPPSHIHLVQHLYLQAPSKRVYMRDDREALAAYYGVSDAEDAGSVYQGLSESSAIHIDRSNTLGSFMLEEIKHFLAGLRLASRTWSEERAILKEGAAWRGAGRRPCVRLRAVFFDVDGVLLNSLPLHEEAWQIAFASAGINFTKQMTHREEGRRGIETIRKQLRDAGLPEDETLIHEIDEVNQKELARLGPAPLQRGARELVEAVAKSDVPIWVVTGSSDETLRARLSEQFEPHLAPERIILGMDMREGQPDPDSYLLGCSRARVHPHEAVAIENAPLGVQAAEAAGMFCVGLNTGALGPAALLDAGSRAVFDSCEHLARSWPQLVKLLNE